MLEPLLEIGFNNYIFPSRVVAILNPEIASTRRLVQEAKASGKVIDVTSSAKTISVILLDTGDVVLSSIDGKIIQSRYHKHAISE